MERMKNLRNMLWSLHGSRCTFFQVSLVNDVLTPVPSKENFDFFFFFLKREAICDEISIKLCFPKIFLNYS